MPDIKMCEGLDARLQTCPKRNKCFRYKATPNPYRQFYFVFAPFEISEDGEFKCDSFDPL
jgi:hypothetical protein